MATSSNQSGFVDSWQRGKSVIECNLHMLETEDFTDVTFLVGSEKQVVRAHRYVLASRSCVFHAMFCGRMAEQGEITIPDIEENVFRDFLRFLYTDSCIINSENVAGLMYTARKYDVETLFTQSASFLEKSLSEDNVCEILEKSHGYGETDLEQKALKMLSQAGPKVIKSAAFLDLCSKCFGLFLESDELQLKEEEVFETALAWTKAECEREGLSPSHENMRKVLGEMVYEIRFASLSLEYLTKEVGPSGIMTLEERVRIMDGISDNSIDIRPFKSDVRGSIAKPQEREQDIHYVKRFDSILPASKHSGWDGIAFSTNNDITVLGIRLYGTDREQITRLDTHIYNDWDTLISQQFQNWTLRNNSNDIMFPNPVSIQAGRLYTILCHLSPNTSCCSGSKGRSKVTKAGVEFTFTVSNTNLSRTYCSAKEGRIHGLIWRY